LLQNQNLFTKILSVTLLRGQNNDFEHDHIEKAAYDENIICCTQGEVDTEQNQTINKKELCGVF
jgi:hypothetical protein